MENLSVFSGSGEILRCTQEDLIYMDAATGAYISSLGSLQGHA